MTTEHPAGDVSRSDASRGTVRLDALLAHRAWVRSLARRLVTDPNAADDVEQETWRLALERPPQRATSLRAWLSAVVRNAARGAGRSRERRRAHEIAAPLRPAESAPEDTVAEAELQHRLVGAVLALAEPYRDVVLARYFEGREATEIAARSGAPVETVRTRLKRAVALLRERMDAELGDDDAAWCLLVAGWKPIAVTSAGTGGPATGALAGAGSEKSAGAAAALTGAAGGVAMGLAGKLGVAAAVLVIALLAWRPWTDSAVSGGRGGGDWTQAADPSQAPARAAGRAKARDDATPTRPSHDPCAAAPPDEARFAACDRDLDLHGIVVRKDGEPVASAALQAVTYPWRRANALHWDGAFEASLGPSTTSAADGTFALHLRRGESVSLRVTKDGLAPLELVDRSAGERLRVVMEPGVRLVVRAVQHVPDANDFREDPVPDVRLRVWRMLPRDGGTTVDVRGVTGADGRATFDDLPGALDVTVMPESRLGNVGMKRLRLAESGESKLDLVLAPGRTIRGRVTDVATGASVAGARVGMAWPLVQAVTTQGDGTYALEGWTSDGYSDVHVLAPGYVRANRNVGGDETLDFALQPGVAARGRVVGADGNPVGGALVSCMAMWRGDRVQHMSSADARADGDGVFRLTGLDGTRPHTMTVVAPGAGRLQKAIAFPPNPAGEIDLGDVALAAARAIEGRVLDPTGAPAARIPVSLSSADLAPSVAENLGPGSRETRFTDDLGRFRFPDLAAGTYVVTAGDDGRTDRTARVVLPADRDVLDVVLPPQGAQAAVADAAVVTVTVTDDAGAPVAGLHVIANPNGGGSRVQATSDRQGRAVLRPVAGDRIKSIVLGSMDASQAFLRMPPVRVERGRTEYAVQVERGVLVDYVILGPDGAPVERAMVRVEPDDKATTWGMTDAAGRARVALPREGTFSLVFEGTVFEGEKYVPADTGLEARADGVTAASGEVVLHARRVETGRRVTVRLLEDDGTPAAGLDVTLLAGGNSVGSSKTDSNGRASFEGLAARPTTVSTALRPGTLNLRPQPFVPDGREVVVRFPASIRISGIAMWSSGEPAAGAQVSVIEKWHGHDALTCWTTCGDDGRFAVRIPADGAGPYEIWAGAMRADRTPAGVERPLAPTDRDIQLVLPR